MRRYRGFLVYEPSTAKTFRLQSRESSSDYATNASQFNVSCFLRSDAIAHPSFTFGWGALRRRSCQDSEGSAADRISPSRLFASHWPGRDTKKRSVELLHLAAREDRISSQPHEMPTELFPCCSRNLEGFLSRCIGQTIWRLLPNLALAGLFS